MEKRLILCDTDFFIEYCRKNIPAIQVLENIGFNNIFLSNITVAELKKFATNKESLKRLNLLLSRFPIIEINNDISDIFNTIVETYVLSHKPSITDILIASNAMYYDLEILTMNTSDFAFIKGLSIYNHKIKPLDKEKGWLDNLFL